MNERGQAATVASISYRHVAARLLPAAGLTLAYFAAALLGILLGRPPASLAGIWLADAIALSFLLRQDKRQWPLSFGALLAGCLAAYLLTGRQPLAAIGLTFAHLVDVAVAATLIRWWLGRSINLEGGLGTYARLQLVAAGLAPLIGAAIAAAVATATLGLSAAAVGWSWWSGTAAGAIVILPVTLWASPQNLRQTFRGPYLRRFVLLCGMSVVTMNLAIAFSRFPYVIFSLPLAITAFRTNPFATALTAALSVTSVIVLYLGGFLPVRLAGGAALDASIPLFGALAVLMPFCISLLIEQQKRERAFIAESEERFRNAMEHSAIGMALVGRDGAWLRVNRALSDMLGYSFAEFQSLTFQEITHPDDLAADLDLVNRVLRGEIDNYRMEKRYFRKDGSVVDALLAVSCVRDKATGDTLYFVSQIEDITARKAAEAALEKSESRWNFALESARQGVWDFDIPANKAFYSPVWKALFGYAPDEFGDAGDAWEAMIHPDDLDRVLTVNREALSSPSGAFECEYRMRHRDGRWVWILDRGRVIERDAAGAPLRMIGTYTDITRRREAEAALEAIESRWNFALESARQGVWDHDVVAGKTFYSPVWGSILGYDADEVSSHSPAWLDFVHPDDLAILDETFRGHLEGPKDFFEVEFRMRHKDGRWVWILDRGKVVQRDVDGKPVRIIGTHTDITSRKQAEAKIEQLSQRVQLAVRAGGVGLWEFNPVTREQWWDGRMQELYGVGPEELRGTHLDWQERVHPDDRERVIAEGRAAFLNGTTYDTEFRIVLPDGQIRYIRALAEIVRNDEGAPHLMVGTNWDITENRLLTDALFQQKERLQITLQSIGDGVISTDTQSRITFMNTVAEELTGWTAAEALGQPFSAVIRIVEEASGETAPSPIPSCLAGTTTKTTREGVTLLSRRGRRDIRETAAPVRTASGEIVGVVLVLQDMTEARHLQRQLTHSATHDALTGLANRSSFEAALSAACAGLEDSKRQHAVCFIDLDRFKIVNDTAGHAAGDALLREIGRIIRQSVRGHDITARLGGDEFGLLLYDCAAEQGEIVAEKMIHSVRSLPFVWDGRAYDVGASVGLTVVSAASSVPGELLSQADIACYTAKALGRNRVAVYRAGESEARRQHRDLQVAARIRGAIETDRFRLYAQEIRRLQPGAPAGRHYEILLRMLDEDGSILEADAFIPAAERYDLMANIDRWVLGAVLGDYGARIAAEPDLSISVNLSANSLGDPHFWPFLESELAASSLPAGRVRLEITETSLINNLSASSLLVESAREAGCAIVLDDFGTGLSSFAYLKRFPIDYLKIDGSFMKTLTSSGVDRAIVKSINDIAHKLGAATIAEWVENLETAEVLRTLGVDHAQGFAIAPPVPIDEILSAASLVPRAKSFGPKLARSA